MKSFAQKGIDIRKWLEQAFELVFAVSFMVIFALCLTGTQHNIPWYNMTVVTLLALAGICGVYWALGRLEGTLAKGRSWLFPLFCAVWGIALYAFSCVARNEPAHDYQIVYDAALNLAQGQAVDWTYFARWGNNTFLLLLLSFLMKAGFALGLADPFYLLLLFSVLSVVGTGACIYRLLGWALGNRKNGGLRLQWMGVLLFVGFIPCWGGTFNFYTDAASLSFSIFAVTAAVRASRIVGSGNGKKDEEKDGKEDRKNGGVKLPAGIFCFSFLAGALWSIGFLLKATAAVSLLAFFLVELWQEKGFMWKRRLFCVLAGFVLMWGAFQLVSDELPNSVLFEEYAAPVEYWLAIGMSGNGGYGENEELATLILETPGYDGKKAVAREYISSHMDRLFEAGHLTAKLRYNFASGNFGLADYNRYPVTPFYEFFNDYGSYGGYVTMISSGYFYAILCLLVFGGLRSLAAGGTKKGDEQFLRLTAQLTLFSLFIFLMLWEANNRQLYNHMPWLALAGAMSLDIGRKCEQKLFHKEALSLTLKNANYRHSSH